MNFISMFVTISRNCLCYKYYVNFCPIIHLHIFVWILNITSLPVPFSRYYGADKFLEFYLFLSPWLTLKMLECRKASVNITGNFQWSYRNLAAFPYLAGICPGLFLQCAFCLSKWHTVLSQEGRYTVFLSSVRPYV
jgi:hypothetical protein